MPRSYRPFHGLLTFGVILVVGVVAVGRSLWLSGPGPASSAAAAPELDLAAMGWYARLGFSDADRSGFSPTEPGVRAVGHLPIHLNEVFGIPPGTTARDFAVMTAFSLSPETAAQTLAFSLAELGDNWAVYVNGVEVRREIFLGAKGQILVHRSLQRVLILLPPGALRAGPNQLVIRFVGEPPATPFFAGWSPGLSMAQGYVLAPAGKLVRERALQEAISWFQIGVYFFVGLNYLLIFLRQREDYALFFSLFLFACVTYSFVYSSLAFDIVPDSTIISRVMYVANLCSPGLIGMTLWSYFYPQQPASMELRLLLGATATGCLALWLVPYTWLDPVFNLYLFVILASVMYLIGLVIQAARRGLPDAGKIVATAPFIFAMVLWAILDQLVFRTNVDLTGWIPFFLAVAFALIFVDRFWRLQKDLVETNRQLTLSHDHLEDQVEARSAELRAANTELSATNQRLTDSGRQVQSAFEEVRRLNADLERRVEERTIELRLAKEAADAANRAKTAFLAIMGHELRTPLNGIFLAAEMLREHDLGTGSLRDLPEIILTSGRRLLRMVEGVLEYATADTHPGSALLQAEIALQEVAIRFETRAAQQGVELAFHLSPGLPLVRFEAHQFDLVMRRLLENALRFTPEGGRVTVTAEPVGNWIFAHGEKPALRIRVADTGVGLKGDDCDRIFEPFVQVEASYLLHSEGVGLGLTLARRQVELYGGRLWAESEGVGKGSRFSVLLPAMGALPA